MADQAFIDWAKKQKHKPEDKITNFQKLASPYIINKYKTWGELYDSLGVEPAKEAPAKEKTGKVDMAISYAKLNSQYQTAKGSQNVWKNIAQDPNESPERRQEALDKYNDLTDQVRNLRGKLDKLERQYDKVEGGKDVRRIQADYQDLLEQKSLLLDPNDERGQKIDKEIDKLAKEYQNAYSRFIGTRVSLGVARSNLTKIGIPTLAGGEAAPASAAPTVVGQQPVKGTTPTAPAPTPAPTVPKSGTSKTPAKTPSKTATSTAPTPGTALPASFTPTDVTGSMGEAKKEQLLGAAADFSLPEVLFKNVPSLKQILDTALAQNWTTDKLRNAIRNDVWYRQNSAEIKNRFIQKFNYDDLVEKGQATGSTDYEKQIASIEKMLKKKAAAMGSAAVDDPTALRKAAENLYITNRSEDDSYITDFLAAAIKPMAGMIGGKVTQGYTGQALADYQQLQAIAKANGFTVADIIPGGANEQQVLGMIASGTVDINRIAQDARKLAAQGQPEYVRQLLGQGYNLDQVFSPYRQVMANVLEISDPNQIDLNDPVLRSAITDKGDMNLYDFKKALRSDKRWEYTDNARQEVSNATMRVLRDFGFQG